jgi:hypothetical protein
MQAKMPASTEQSKQNQTVHSPTQLFVEPQAVFADHRQQSVQLKETQTNMAVSQQQQGLQALQAKMNTGSRIQQLKEQQAHSNQSPKPNNTGLPDNLKSGIENLSGMSMDHVKVHYNSDKPAQLQAHAYAQGSDIHVAPGQEQHVAHEAWHVVQQAQGRVRPTVQMQDGVGVNDDAGLESEADEMGAKALASVQLVKHEGVGALNMLPVQGNKIFQCVLSDSAQVFVDEALTAKGLSNYATEVVKLSSAKKTVLDNLWATIGEGKKRARKVVAARTIATQIKTYLDSFALKAANWNAGTYSSAQLSMEDHFVRHPGTWEDVEEYTDAAIAFKTTNWASRYTFGQVNRQRMQDASFFLITTDAGEIVTFGKR